MEDATGIMCGQCGGPNGHVAPCPYQSEINDDETPCDCCDACRSQCADEI